MKKVLVSFITMLFFVSSMAQGIIVTIGGTHYISGENILVNPSFEENPDDHNHAIVGWTIGDVYKPMYTTEGGGNFLWFAEGGRDGGAYIQANKHTGAGGDGSVCQRWNIQPGKKYYFSFWLAKNTVDDQYVPVLSLTNKISENGGENEEVNLLGGSGASFGCANYNNGEWCQTVVTFDSEDNSYLQFNARWLKGGDTGVCFDDFYLAELTPVGAGTYVFHINNPGTLADSIPDTEKENVTTLVLSGTINGDDMTYVKSLPNLRNLDIEKAVIKYESGEIRTEESELMQFDFTVAPDASSKAVYANTNSAKAELETATLAVKEAVENVLENSASPEKPLDMTAEYVTNPDFEENVNGWTTTTGAQNNALATNKTAEADAGQFEGHFYENWNASAFAGKMYQVLRNIPKGVYTLEMGAFCNASKGAYVYANGDSVEVVNSSPKTYKVTTIVEVDTIEIGLKQSEAISNWVGMDKVRVTYYGNSVDSYKMYISNTTTPAEEYEKEGVYVQQAVLDAYKAALVTAQNATSKEEILVCAPAIYEANDNVRANANAYAAYVAAVEESIQYFSEHTEFVGDDVEFVTWYLMSEDGPDEDYPNGGAMYILENCLLSTGEIVAETAFLETLRANAINGRDDGTDMTSVLINPDFKDTSGKGWNYTNGVEISGGLADFPCAEAYERAFDVYQDVNIQDGLYEVSVNAFYRPSANGSYGGTETVLAEIYLNEFATPVQHIMADCSDECAYDSGDWMMDYETPNGWIPNSMNGASTAFKAGRYKQTVYGLVSGGKLRLGIRSIGKAHWCLWSNFKLTYRAKNSEVLAFVINSMIENAQPLLKQEMFSADLEALQVAIANAQEAQGGDAMYDALVALNASVVNAKNSIQAYIAYLRLPDVSEASGDNPIDVTQVIVNPTFDEGNADGWDYSSFTHGNRGYFPSSYTNPASGASCDQFIEAWVSSTTLENAEIVQTLAYLPAGDYALEVDAIACNQSDANTNVTGVYLFAQEEDHAAHLESLRSDDGVPEHFVLHFTKQEADSKLNIGIRTMGTTANWVATDNFKLTYYGEETPNIKIPAQQGSTVRALQNFVLTVEGDKVITKGSKANDTSVKLINKANNSVVASGKTIIVDNNTVEIVLDRKISTAGTYRLEVAAGELCYTYDNRAGFNSDNLFSGMQSLEEVSFFENINVIGSGIFHNCPNLLVVKWNTSSAVESKYFDTPEEMGNLIVYALVGTSSTYKGNVVIGKQASSIMLTDKKPFRCPTGFKTKSITYSRNFGKTTTPGVAGGWEAIVLPFDVKNIVSEDNRTLAPFNNGASGNHPFWLAELTGEGFSYAAQMKANHPYIIAMPNSSEYKEEFNIRGNVIFSADDETNGIAVEPTSMGQMSKGPKFELVPAYETVVQGNTIYAINDETYNSMNSGAVFVRNSRDVSPFEAYARSLSSVVSSPLCYSIGGDMGEVNGIERLYHETFDGMEVYCQNRVLYVNSPRKQTIGLYSADGRLVRLMNLSEGMNIEYGVETGIYFIGKRKVIVK